MEQINCGEEIEEDYEVYKYCAKHSIYSITSVVEDDVIRNHHDKDRKCSVSSSIEEDKDRIIECIADGGGYDTLIYMQNKTKFFRDYGFKVIPGRFTSMELGEVREEMY